MMKIIDDFFDRYEARFNNAIKGGSPDMEETAAAFCDSFVSANPAGVYCGKNDDKFRTVTAQGYRFYKNIGITAMQIVSKDTTRLDEMHAMTKVHWKSVLS